MGYPQIIFGGDDIYAKLLKQAENFNFFSTEVLTLSKL